MEALVGMEGKMDGEEALKAPPEPLPDCAQSENRWAREGSELEEYVEGNCCPENPSPDARYEAACGNAQADGFVLLNKMSCFIQCRPVLGDSG
nr:hypothetical protein BaRGS_030652 [Batillaria attramentaria]